MKSTLFRFSAADVLKVPTIVVLVLGALLAAGEAVQINITMSTQAHDAITLVVTLISGLGVMAATPSSIAKVVPHQILVLITAVLGTLNVLQTSSFSLATWLHTVIAVVIVIGNTLFTVGPPSAPVKV